MTNEKVKEFLQTIDEIFLKKVIDDLKEGDIKNLPDSVLTLIDEVINKCQEKAPKLLYDYIRPSFGGVQFWRTMLGLCDIEIVKYDQTNDEIYLDLGERDGNGKCIFKVVKRHDVIIITPEVKTEEKRHDGGRYFKSHKPQYWILSYDDYLKLYGNHSNLIKLFEREDYPNAYYGDSD